MKVSGNTARYRFAYTNPFRLRLRHAILCHVTSESWKSHFKNLFDHLNSMNDGQRKHCNTPFRLHKAIPLRLRHAILCHVTSESWQSH